MFSVFHPAREVVYLSLPFTFPYDEILRSTSRDEILKALKSARSEGCQPLLILAVEQLLEVISCNERTDESLPDFSEYAKQYVDELLNDEDMAPLPGSPSDTAPEAYDDPLQFLEIDGDSPLVLAKIPAAQNQEIMKHLPLGS